MKQENSLKSLPIDCIDTLGPVQVDRQGFHPLPSTGCCSIETYHYILIHLAKATHLCTIFLHMRKSEFIMKRVVKYHMTNITIWLCFDA